ncbi:MAG TPA: hypothetical protein VFD92_04610 [Candidatus Binatia bacterium]|nr:hypothetical protein [Candidatus Binatia bacterium]
MSSYLGSSIERLRRRTGFTITVKRKTGAFNRVTATRASGEQSVSTPATYTRGLQRSIKGDPLTSAQAYYGVPSAPFVGVFEPRDSDLVVDGSSEYRILSVEPQRRGADVVGYRLYVGGVVS